LITEAFINACYLICLNRYCNIKRNKALYRDILEVLEFTTDKETIDIPIELQSKLDCLKNILLQLVDGKSLNNSIENVVVSEKYKQYRDFIRFKSDEKISDEEFQEIIRQIRLRKKLKSLFSNYDDIKNLVEAVNNLTFDSVDDLIKDYENIVKTLYANLMEVNRAITIEAAASLDLIKDDFDHVLQMILKKYDHHNATPTGYDIFDKIIFNGGFEPSRLYVFGGGSGAGKSTLLNNVIIKSAQIPNLKKKKRVYIYITLENTIEESLMRTYQPLFDKSKAEMLMDIKQGIDIRKKIVDELNKTNSTIVMKYYPAMSITPMDLISVIDEVIEEYGKDSIAGLYVDYLDLLKSDFYTDLYRIELSHIALAMKTLAVEYNIPIITATQLKREVYKISEASELNLQLMSESIKKVDHADFVALMAANANNDRRIHCRIGKNRSGKNNVMIDFIVNFEHYKYISGTTVKKKDDDGKGDSGMKFAGLSPI
jgi:replicative DNA helicase